MERHVQRRVGGRDDTSSWLARGQPAGGPGPGAKGSGPSPEHRHAAAQMRKSHLSEACGDAVVVDSKLGKQHFVLVAAQRPLRAARVTGRACWWGWGCVGARTQHCQRNAPPRCAYVLQGQTPVRTGNRRGAKKFRRQSPGLLPGPAISTPPRARGAVQHPSRAANPTPPPSSPPHACWAARKQPPLGRTLSRVWASDWLFPDFTSAQKQVLYCVASWALGDRLIEAGAWPVARPTGQAQLATPPGCTAVSTHPSPVARNPATTTSPHPDPVCPMLSLPSGAPFQSLPPTQQNTHAHARAHQVVDVRVHLAPAEIVPQDGQRRIAHRPAVKQRRGLKRAARQVPVPEPDVRGSEARHRQAHQLGGSPAFVEGGGVC